MKQSTERRVFVIGGGPSGMMAAITAARAGARVTIFEHKDRVGKKLLSTGNGRCNLTNRDQKPEYYRDGGKQFAWPVVQRFSQKKTERFFEDLGVVFKERKGYVYPNSDQALTVLEALTDELHRLSIRLILNCQIESAKAEKDGTFLVKTDQGSFWGDRLILAAGSKAAPVTGSDGSGYELAKSFGHRIQTPLPALVQLRCKESHYKQLAGIRCDASVQLLVDGQPVAEDLGEVQLTDYGISGIPVFQVSRFASKALHNQRTVTAVLDFLPSMEPWEAAQMLSERRRRFSDRTWEQWMSGLFQKKLGLVLLKLSGLRPDQMVKDTNGKAFENLVRQITAYETVIAKANGFDKAQICCGGVELSEVSPDTMESRRTPGLYFAGEILDVDGICGGYNLQWAFSSGHLAGEQAAR